MLGPDEPEDLENPEFQAYLRHRCGPGKITPDKQDFDRRVNATSNVEHAHQYRRAQMQKIMRPYREWKTAQN
jgi:hypothetical protein